MADSACSALPVECVDGTKKELRNGQFRCATDTQERNPASSGAALGTWELAQWPTASGHKLDAIVGPGCSGASMGAV